MGRAQHRVAAPKTPVQARLRAGADEGRSTGIKTTSAKRARCPPSPSMLMRSRADDPWKISPASRSADPTAIDAAGAADDRTRAV